jgi:hypothetical protein
VLYSSSIPQNKSGLLIAQLAVLLKVLLFIPWCLAVGGAILLVPEHMGMITFAPGYVPMRKGVRRLAHWAELGPQHVGIFVCSLGSLLFHMRDAQLTMAVFALLAAGMFRAWGGFRVDRTIPLGEDDMQSVGHVACYVFGGGWALDGIAIRASDGTIMNPKIFDECT